MIDVVIVDDESLARTRLARLLGAESDVRIVAECATAASAIEAIGARTPAVVFLDIQMPRGDGFEVVRGLPVGREPLVVFVTAFDEHAVRAFEVNALDYLLKPFGADRVADTMRRVREHLASESNSGSALAAIEEWRAAARGFPMRLTVKQRGVTRLVPVASIDVIEAIRNRVNLRAGGETIVLNESLTEVERRLDPSVFVRVHRGTIVNVTRVQEIQARLSGDATIVLADRSTLRVSRTFRAALERALSSIG